MFGKHNNASIRPYALGISPQSSVYGATIPVVYGTTKVTPQLIWAANLRQAGGSNKTVKVKKNGPATYAENVDFLLGQNPLNAVLQMWQNQGGKQGMSFASQAFSISPGGVASVTITDPYYYFLLGVTLRIPYNTTFRDYGSQGGRHLSGTTEYPLWNAAFAGPDRLNVGGWKHYPYVYRWVPFSGAVIELPLNALGALPAGVLTAYYCKTNGPSSPQIPMSNLRLTFETKLGNGPEYSGFASQQIIYPDYAGMGSPNIDMGSTQMLPTILAEVVGAFPLYPRGDCDFVDMIEDVFKGVGQSVPGIGPGYSSIYHGLNCFDFPGAIQKKMVTSDVTISTVKFDLPVTEDSTLIVAARNSGSSSMVFTDSQGNAYTGLGSSPLGWDVEDAGPGLVTTGPNTLTITGSDVNSDVQLIEVSGLDTLFGPPEATGTDGPITGAVTVSPVPGEPCLIIAIVIAFDGAGSIQPATPPQHWNNLMVGVGRIFSMYRVVNQPGEYTFTVNPFFTGDWALVFKTFTNSTPVPWPKPIGGILDEASLLMVRNQCRANNLIGSLVMDSQRKAVDWLTDIYQCANAAPVWSGFKLKSIPWSEVSAVGNGAIYDAPTAVGPLVDLITDDFIADPGQPLIKISRRAQVDTENILQIQHPSRDADYNDITVDQPDQATIALYGGRKKTPKVLRMLQNLIVARTLLGVATRRVNYLRNTYKFTLQAKWQLLEAMDLVTLTDIAIGLDHQPVRLLTVNENERYELECTAEPYQYGVNSPLEVVAGQPDPYVPDREAVPALVNAPVLFEPVKQLAGFPTIDQLWAIVSNADPNYGGCQVYISTDGGSSYVLIGTITGNGITGVTTQNWPAAADPDFTNTLRLNLSESNGELASYDAADKDNFIYPCWVDGGAGSIPYELMTYDIADLTGTNLYDLDPTNGLRRSVYDAPTAGVGVDHPIDSRFAFIGQGTTGIVKMDIQDTLIGVALFFKFVGFNQFGAGNQNIADCVAYPFTPTGLTIAP